MDHLPVVRAVSLTVDCSLSRPHVTDEVFVTYVVCVDFVTFIIIIRNDV